MSRLQRRSRGKLWVSVGWNDALLFENFDEVVRFYRWLITYGIRLLYFQPHPKARQCKSKLWEWTFGTVCIVHVCTTYCTDQQKRKEKKETKKRPGYSTVRCTLRGYDRSCPLKILWSIDPIRFKKLKIETHHRNILSLSLCHAAVTMHCPRRLSPTRWSLERYTAKYLKW